MNMNHAIHPDYDLHHPRPPASNTLAFISGFNYRVEEHSTASGPKAVIGFDSLYDEGPFHPLGTPEDILPDYHDDLTPLTWRSRAAEHDSDTRKSLLKSHSESQSLHVLSRVAAYTGMRLDPTKGWRMLELNAVVHFQFGMGITVATDGSRVLLFKKATIPTIFFVVHRNNVIGPVTSTPVRPSEWNYLKNSAVGTPTAGGGRRVPKPAKPSLLQRALDVLNIKTPNSSSIL